MLSLIIFTQQLLKKIVNQLKAPTVIQSVRELKLINPEVVLGTYRRKQVKKTSSYFFQFISAKCTLIPLLFEIDEIANGVFYFLNLVIFEKQCGFVTPQLLFRIIPNKMQHISW